VEDGGGDGMMLSFWGDPSLGRGAPLRFLRHALEHAKRLVFYNAAFDLTLAAGGDDATIRKWWMRTFDPYKLLRDAFGTSVRLKLDLLLRDNWLAPKTASGIEAVRMYTDGRHGELERYNRTDVEALRSLVELERIRLSNGQYTSIGRMLNLRVRLTRSPRERPRSASHAAQHFAPQAVRPEPRPDGAARRRRASVGGTRRRLKSRKTSHSAKIWSQGGKEHPNKKKKRLATALP